MGWRAAAGGAPAPRRHVAAPAAAADAAAPQPPSANARPEGQAGALEALLEHILVRRDPGADGAAPPHRRAPLDNEYLVGLVMQHRRHLAVAALCLLLCTASNLAAPVLSGLLFETLVQRQPMERYAQVFSVLLAGYVLEPLLTKVYMENVIALGEKVLATLRMELFRTLLMQKIEFFDRHSASELQGLLSVELDTIRGFVFA